MIELKDMSSGTIPIIKELSRSFSQIFDCDRTSLNMRNEIKSITAIYPNSGISGVVIIEGTLDEIILVSMLTPHT
jgi:hypothetical protein